MRSSRREQEGRGCRQRCGRLPGEWVSGPEPAVIMGTQLGHLSVQVQQQQLALALQRFGHFAVFSYSQLFRKQASEVGQSLLPFLQVLAHASSVPDPLQQPGWRAHSHPEEGEGGQGGPTASWKMRGGGRWVGSSDGKVVLMRRRTWRRRRTVWEWNGQGGARWRWWPWSKNKAAQPHESSGEEKDGEAKEMEEATAGEDVEANSKWPF